ncbi:phage Gp37/Gp68 family protein [Dyella marensis]|uniref:Protein gp37 n=1 Tax=Dyella marensis TaxID=500610 RepID=A0A1I2A378_9GAMM|nr:MULTISPECIES: phage Gp37/Gp68 family protein [Dyella]SFE38584.1 protein gp37 [Dyella marensis]
MADGTKIEWADATFNPWIGCTKVSPACDHCYASVSTPARAQGIVWGAGQPRRRTSAANWKLPLRWNKADNYFECRCGHRGGWDQFAAHPTCPLRPARRRVFCASLADVFDNEVPASWRIELFDLIRATPHLDWLLLTKRIGNAERMIDEAGGWSGMGSNALRNPLPNVWLGATVANQAEADRDIPKLLRVPAMVRFLSIEPMLGPINFRWTPYAHQASGESYRAYLERRGAVNVYEALRQIDWVIAGGESGPQARPAHPDWYRSLRDQCAAAGVPFLFKLWGEWATYDRGRTDGATLASPYSLDRPLQRFGKKAAGRMLDGREHNGFPLEAGKA